MKNKKIIPLLVLMLAGGFVSAQNLTGTTGTGSAGGTGFTTGVVVSGMRQEIKGIRNEIKKNYSLIRGNWASFHEDFGYASRYLKRPLTGSALSGAKAIIKEKNTAIKAINSEIKLAIAGSGIVDWTGLFVKYEAVYRSFAIAITPYIAPTKLDAFNNFIEAKIATIKKNLQLRKKNITLKEQRYEKAQNLKEKKAAALKEKQESLKKRQESLKEKQEGMKAKQESSKKKGK